MIYLTKSNKSSLKSQTCMDEDDPQLAQSLSIDVIQLLQRIQSGASIPLKTQGHINNNNNAVLCLSPQQQTEDSGMKLDRVSDSLTYFRSRRI